MANARIGSHPSHGYCIVETLDTTLKQLGSGDSGKVFMCVQNGSADVEVFLPKLSTDIAGWQAKFVLKTAAANDVFITAFGSSAAGSTAEDSDSIIALEEADTNTVSAAADAIGFVGGSATAGDWCELMTDGTSWYSHQHASADAGSSAPG